MFLRAGALSLALLVASRLLGLLRESALAAAFGASGLGDVAVLMLTLPDWMAGVFASGALAYVMLPAWSGQAAPHVARTQRKLARVLCVAGACVAVVLVLLRGPALDVLAPGLGAAWRTPGASALVWSAVALPLALLAALWATRLQHEREFVGMYGANLVVNAVFIACLWLLAVPGSSDYAVTALGAGLLAAMVLRLAWLAWRLPAAPVIAADADAALPPAATWLWAALAAGLPLALPFAARSAASGAGEGSLATFNYAWKLVELPLLLAIQLVATLAFPAVARAFAGDGNARQGEVTAAVRPAVALAWAFACAAAAGLLLAAPAAAQLLFGWGRMDARALASVAEWGRIGAWGLLPQAIIAVALTVLAAQRRMHGAVIAYAVALVALLATSAAGMTGGAALMTALNWLLAGVAAALVVTLRSLHGCVPWRTMFASSTCLAIVAVLAVAWPVQGIAAPIAAAIVAAVALLVVTAWASPDLRAALRR